MGCDTKGFVVTDNIDVREIGKRVIKVVRTIHGQGNNAIVKNSNLFARLIYEPELNYYVLHFKDGDDERQMFVHMGTEDFEMCYGIGKNGIIFDLGMWGNSVELIRKFLDTFQDMGECYIQVNDCVNDPVPYKN